MEFRIANVRSGQLLDVQEESAVDGAPIIQFHETGHLSQRWRLESVGSGYKIVNSLTGKVLEVPQGATESGVPIRQWSDRGSSNQNQQWQLRAAGDGVFRIVSVINGKLLGVNWGDGAQVIQYQAEADAPETWVITLLG